VTAPDAGEPGAAPAVQLEPVDSVAVPGRPWGIGVTPDGRHVVVTGRFPPEIQVLDAETLERTAEAIHGEPWGVVIPPEGDRVFLMTKQAGISAATLPDLADVERRAAVRTRQAFSLPSRDGFVAWGVAVGNGTEDTPLAERGVFLFDRDFRVRGSVEIPTQDNTAIASTSDGERVVAVWRGSVHVLDARTLATLARFEAGSGMSSPWLVIPLADPAKVLFVSGISRGPGDAVPAARVVGVDTGTLGPVQILEKRFPQTTWLEYGMGNPWVAIGGDLAVAGFRGGLVLIDTRAGRLLEWLQEVPMREPEWCCSVAYDPGRDRLFVAGQARSDRERPLHYQGRVFVFDVVR